MNQLPKVSVVIPSYNHGPYIQATIQSVIDQDYENIELIVIDDGSKDASVEKISAMVGVCKERFKRFEFRARENRGLCATLNEAIAWCDGAYFSAIASDDLMKVCKTRVQVDYLEQHKDCTAVFGGIDVLDAAGQFVAKYKVRSETYDFKKIFLLRQRICAPTQMIRTANLKAIGGYREDLAVEDLYMWLMLSAEFGTLDTLPTILAGYRRHESNTSKRIEAMNIERVRIIDLFSSHPLYRRAKANALVNYAIDVQLYDKARSLSLLRDSIQLSWMEVFQPKVFRYVAKMFFTQSALEKLR